MSDELKKHNHNHKHKLIRKREGTRRRHIFFKSSRKCATGVSIMVQTIDY